MTKKNLKCSHYTQQINALHEEITEPWKAQLWGGEGGKKRTDHISLDGLRDNLLQNVMASQDEQSGVSGYKH